MSEDRHPGISMHKLPVGGGFIGILFALGSAVIFILGFPTLWYFVAFSAAFGGYRFSIFGFWLAPHGGSRGRRTEN